MRETNQWEAKGKGLCLDENEEREREREEELSNGQEGNEVVRRESLFIYF